MNGLSYEYHSDFYAWLIHNAALMRQGKLAEIDVENVAEELEAMGRSEKRALESRLTVLLTHLLKWHYQPVRRGKSWELTIKEQRLRIQKLLRDNPSIRKELQPCFLECYQFAIFQAVKETAIEEKTFPSVCQWTIEQTLNNDFFPD